MPQLSIGVVLALLVLVLCVVLIVINQMDPKLGVLIGALALARVVP